MIGRLHEISTQELNLLHDATMGILADTGICFNSESALALCKKHGLKTEGNTVYFSENDITKALKTVPNKFTLRARNPEKNSTIGVENYIFLPTGGATNIVLPSGKQRPASIEDFRTCCKLVQTSQQLDMAGYLMVQPHDIPSKNAHLDMLATYISHCDKPIFGASNSKKAVQDCIKMVSMIWGGEENIQETPVLLTNINAMSPLQYASEQTAVIMEMAKWRQPVVITTMVLAGSTGPVSLPGVLVLQNAEILAGIALAQLVNPGTPVVYGSTSTPIDMKTMISTVGAPETAKLSSATAQIAQFYKMPCRTGGMLTDSHMADAQALAESALLLSTAVRDGAHFIFHAAGQMGSYISMGFEKWLIDEEVCAMVRQLNEPMEITAASIDTDHIKNVGVGGEYLTHPKTFKQFKRLYQSQLFNRSVYEKWSASGSKSITEVATERLKTRLAEYQAPSLDSEIEKAIQEFVKRRKKEG